MADKLDVHEESVKRLMTDVFGEMAKLLTMIRSDGDRTVTVRGPPLGNQTYIFVMTRGEQGFSKRITIDGEPVDIMELPIGDSKADRTPRAVKRHFKAYQRHCLSVLSGMAAAGGRVVCAEGRDFPKDAPHPVDMVYQRDDGVMVHVEIKTYNSDKGVSGHGRRKEVDMDGRIHGQTDAVPEHHVKPMHRNVMRSIRQGKEFAESVNALYELVIVAKDAHGVWLPIVYSTAELDNGDVTPDEPWVINGRAVVIPQGHDAFVSASGDGVDTLKRDSSIPVLGRGSEEVSTYFDSDAVAGAIRSVETYNYVEAQGEHACEVIAEYARTVAQPDISNTRIEMEDAYRMAAHTFKVASVPDEGAYAPMTNVNYESPWLLGQGASLPLKANECRQTMSLGFPCIELRAPADTQSDTMRRTSAALEAATDGEGHAALAVMAPLNRAIEASLERGGAFAHSIPMDGTEPFKCVEVDAGRITITKRNKSNGKDRIEMSDVEAKCVGALEERFLTSKNRGLGAARPGVRNNPYIDNENLMTPNDATDSEYQMPAVLEMLSFLGRTRDRKRGMSELRAVIGHLVMDPPEWASEIDKQMFNEGIGLLNAQYGVENRLACLSTYLMMRRIQVASEDRYRSRNHVTTSKSFSIVDHPLGGQRACVRRHGERLCITMVIDMVIDKEDLRAFEIMAGPRKTAGGKHIIGTTPEGHLVVTTGLVRVDKVQWQHQISLYSNLSLEMAHLVGTGHPGGRQCENLDDQGDDSALRSHLLMRCLTMGSLAVLGEGTASVCASLMENAQLIEQEPKQQYRTPLTFAVLVLGIYNRGVFMGQIAGRPTIRAGQYTYYPPYLKMWNGDEGPALHPYAGGKPFSGSSDQTNKEGIAFYVGETVGMCAQQAQADGFMVESRWDNSHIDDASRFFFWLGGVHAPGEGPMPLIHNRPGGAMFSIPMRKACVNIFNLAEALRLQKSALRLNSWLCQQMIKPGKSASTVTKQMAIRSLHGGKHGVFPGDDGDATMKRVIDLWAVENDGLVISMSDNGKRPVEDFPLGLLHALRYGQYKMKTGGMAEAVSAWAEGRPLKGYVEYLSMPVEPRSNSLGEGSSLVYLHGYIARGQKYWADFAKTDFKFGIGSVLESAQSGGTPRLTTTSAAISYDGRDTVSGLEIASVIEEAEAEFGDSSIRSMLIVTHRRMMSFYFNGEGAGVGCLASRPGEDRFTIPLKRNHKKGDKKRNRWFVVKYLYLTLVALSTNLSPALEPERVNTAKETTNLQQAKEFVRNFQMACGGMRLGSLGVFGSVTRALAANPHVKNAKVAVLGMAVAESDGKQFRAAHNTDAFTGLAHLLGPRYGAGVMLAVEAWATRSVSIPAEGGIEFLQRMMAHLGDKDGRHDPLLDVFEKSFLEVTGKSLAQVEDLVCPESGCMVAPSAQGFEEGDANDLAGCGEAALSDVATRCTMAKVDNVTKYTAYMTDKGTIEQIPNAGAGRTMRELSSVTISVTGDDMGIGLCGPPEIAWTPPRGAHMFPVTSGRRQLLFADNAAENFADIYKTIFFALSEAAGIPQSQEKWRLDSQEASTGGVTIRILNPNPCTKDPTKFYSSLPSHRGSKIGYLMDIYQMATEMVKGGTAVDVVSAWHKDIVGPEIFLTMRPLSDLRVVSTTAGGLSTCSTDSMLPAHLVPLTSSAGASLQEMIDYQHTKPMFDDGTPGDKVLSLFESGRGVVKSGSTTVAVRAPDRPMITRDRDKRLVRHIARQPMRRALAIMARQLGGERTYNALAGEGRLIDLDVIANICSPTTITLNTLWVGIKSIGNVICALASDMQITTLDGSEYGVIAPPIARRKPVRAPISHDAMRHMDTHAPRLYPRTSVIAYEVGNVATRKARQTASAVMTYMSGDAATLRNDIGRFDAVAVDTVDADAVIGTGIGPDTKTHALMDSMGTRTVFKQPVTEGDAMTTLNTRRGVLVYETLHRSRESVVKLEKVKFSELCTTMCCYADIHDVKRYIAARHWVFPRTDGIVGLIAGYIFGEPIIRYLNHFGAGANRGNVSMRLERESFTFKSKSEITINGEVLQRSETFWQIYGPTGGCAQVHVLVVRSLSDEMRAVCGQMECSFTDRRSEELMVLYHGEEIEKLAPCMFNPIPARSDEGMVFNRSASELHEQDRLIIRRNGILTRVPAKRTRGRIWSHSIEAVVQAEDPPQTVHEGGSLGVYFKLRAAARLPDTVPDLAADVVVFPRRGFRQSHMNDDTMIDIDATIGDRRCRFCKPLASAAVEMTGDFLPVANGNPAENVVLKWLSQRGNQVFIVGPPQ